MSQLEEQLRKSIEQVERSHRFTELVAAHDDALDVFAEDDVPGRLPANEKARARGWRVVDGGNL